MAFFAFLFMGLSAIGIQILIAAQLREWYKNAGNVVMVAWMQIYFISYMCSFLFINRMSSKKGHLIGISLCMFISFILVKLKRTFKEYRARR